MNEKKALVVLNDILKFSQFLSGNRIGPTDLFLFYLIQNYFQEHIKTHKNISRVNNFILNQGIAL